MNHKFLVPVDGSPASIHALQFAARQALSAGDTSIVLLNVQNAANLGLTDGAGILPPELVRSEEYDAANAVIEEAAALCRGAGVPYATRTELGAIAPTIDRVAREEKVEQIIMGSRGLGGVRGLLLGSVATQLLHLTELPVTLLK